MPDCMVCPLPIWMVAAETRVPEESATAENKAVPSHLKCDDLRNNKTFLVTVAPCWIFPTIAGPDEGISQSLLRTALTCFG